MPDDSRRLASPGIAVLTPTALLGASGYKQPCVSCDARGADCAAFCER
jgi:hypothetical protein